MKLFKCQNCGQVLFFENRNCEKCGHLLGFIPDKVELSALEPLDDGNWSALAVPDTNWRFCDNAQWDACNWLVPSDSAWRFCLACRHNRVIPDLSDEKNLHDWRALELAKHRLFYTLLRLGLPMPNRADDPAHGLVFDFLADMPATPGHVMTGHDEGLITLALTEADDAEREARRTAMGEPYRTLLGHFRHEIGHFYWDRLIKDTGKFDACRAVFGDEREDYDAALQRHYQQGVRPDWQEHFVSAYATTHPWEDFAETWAHYLHIVDSLGTAGAFGLQVHPLIAAEQDLHVEALSNPYQPGHFDEMIAAWLPLTYALNAMNRSMGLGDLYPFILSSDAIKKLGFIHDLVHGTLPDSPPAA